MYVIFKFIFLLFHKEWWTHLWLNEGYASFVEFLCVAHLFPEFDIWTQFVSDTYIPALELDCLRNSHPIEVIYVTHTAAFVT
jgi:aminopeptidase N